jgi:hypothetical protein
MVWAMDANLLAADEPWEGIGNLAFLIVILVLSAVGAILGKVKERAARERAERERAERQERQRRLGGSQPSAAPAPEPARPAPVRTAPQRPVRMAPQRPMRLAPRRPAPLPPRTETVAATGLEAGVAEEVAHLEQGLEGEQTSRRRRLAARAPAEPRIHAAAPPPGATRPEPTLGVNLETLDEAVRAILYSEILGLPKALRAEPESWER